MTYSCWLQLYAKFLQLTEKNLVDCLQDMLVKYGEAILKLADDMPALSKDLLVRLQRAQTAETKRGDN
jgi:hypothetical protein